MKMKSKRAFVRAVSFICAALAVFAIWGIKSAFRIREYEMQISLSRQRAVAELSGYLDTIRTDLYKGLYASTPAMTGKISSSLLQAASAAKGCLSQLPSDDKQLYSVYKFLTQVGDFTDSLNRKVSSGNRITGEEHEQMQQLFRYASSISGQSDYLQQMMVSGTVDFDPKVSNLGSIKETTDLSMSFSDGVKDAESTFSDFPTLIYDGPFADNVLTKKSVLLENEKEISQSAASKIAAKLLGVSEKELNFEYEENSNAAAYVFTVRGGDIHTAAAVTKRGGHLSYILSDAYAGESTMNYDDAVQAAEKFLEKCGYTSMKDTYHSMNDGICTLNFAFDMNGVTCYPDLIKVCVSMDSGSITGFDARGYLMNHTGRRMPENVITAEEARKSVSDMLTVLGVSQAVIPDGASGERYAYEFRCTGSDGDDVLVYVDMQTGMEDDILILLYSDGGVLTK